MRRKSTFCKYFDNTIREWLGLVSGSHVPEHQYLSFEKTSREGANPIKYFARVPRVEITADGLYSRKTDVVTETRWNAIQSWQRKSGRDNVERTGGGIHSYSPSTARVSEFLSSGPQEARRVVICERETGEQRRFRPRRTKG